MLLDMLVLLDSILQMQLFQINQSEDISKIIIPPAVSYIIGPLHQRPTSYYNHIYSIGLGNGFPTHLCTRLVDFQNPK